ncbi:MAG: glycosyltransferase [Candidatus Sumerlaeia bacterium]|nr:glycosyltransferase [Candidatus Sumerlaeia bacterium]
MKRRAAFLIGSMRDGGAEGQLLLLARELAARGHTVALMLLRAEGARLAEARALGVGVFVAGLPRWERWWSPRVWWATAAALARTARFLRRWRPDVFEAWLFHAHVWGAAAALLAGHRGPFLVSRRQLERFKRGRPVARLLDAWASRRADAVVANSRAAARDARRLDPRLRTPIAVVRNGYPADATPRAPADPPRVLCVAHLQPGKGHSLLLGAWARVAVHPSRPRLVLAGRDEGLGAELRAQAERLGVARSVDFAGAAPDLRRLRAEAAFLVHASEEESLPNAVAEAMAAGLAVVATDAGGTRELVADRSTGFLAGRGDADGLAARMLALLNDRFLSERLGAAGRERVRARFTIAAAADARERLWARLLGEARP